MKIQNLLIILSVGLLFFSLVEKTEAAKFKITAPAISPAPDARNNLPNGAKDTPYSFQFKATEPATWTAEPWKGYTKFLDCGTSAVGKLPSEIGLTLTSAGLLSGTSSAVGIFGFSVKAWKDGFNNDHRNFCLTINPAPAAPGGPGGPGGGVIPPPGSGSNAPEKILCGNTSVKTKGLNTYKAANGQTVAYDGLVPCGKCVLVGGNEMVKNGEYQGGGATKNVSCQFCHFFVMFNGIVNFVLFKIVPALAVLMIVIGGVMFFMSAENPAMASDAKRLITYVAIGLVIIFSAWLLVTFFFTFIGVSETGPLKDLVTSPGNWSKIKCEIKI